MAMPTIDRTVLPPAEPLAALVAMLDALGAERTTTLSGPNGEHLVLPSEVFEVLRAAEALLAVTGEAIELCPTYGGAS